MSENKQVITRMAPSPTGNFHIGGVRTALFNYLYARHHGGKFILRSEDTDKERSKSEHEENVLEVFKWLGLEYDEFYRQSERTDIYKEKLQYLIDKDLAYEAEDNQSKTGKVIRFRNPNVKVTFTDLVLGEIEFDTTELQDFVIARDMENPLYHLTVVVDDGLMGVTHILRGQEHVNNTPRQILLVEALGFERPNYAHIPLIMSPRGGKLSKRDPEVIPTLDYDLQGILPEALLNFLALIGWNPGTDQEIFSKSDLVEQFDISKVQKGGAAFNVEKLDWTNKEWLLKMSDEEFIKYLGDVWIQFIVRDEAQSLFLNLLRERAHKRSDIIKMIDEGEFEYLSESLSYDVEGLVWKKSDKETTLSYLREITKRLEDVEQWNMDNVKSAIWDYAEEKGKGDVLWPMRFSLSGKDRSPDPFTLAFILGKEKTLQRISTAIESLV